MYNIIVYGKIGKSGGEGLWIPRKKTIEKKYVYRGKIINVRCDGALLPNGEPCKREIVEHHGGAAILCVTGGKIAFVKQYRYAYGKEVLEIPAGKLEAGEDPLNAAKRELKEETGVSAEKFEKSPKCTLARLYERNYLYLPRLFRFGGGLLRPIPTSFYRCFGSAKRTRKKC